MGPWSRVPRKGNSPDDTLFVFYRELKENTFKVKSAVKKIKELHSFCITEDPSDAPREPVIT